MSSNSHKYIADIANFELKLEAARCGIRKYNILFYVCLRRK
jgi:hypothetical protein